MVIEYHHHREPGDHLGKILGILEENGFGYQIHSVIKKPFRKNEFQDLMVYAYQKESDRAT
jgi:arsenate reductase-like glutaredoxin family protein